MRPDLVTRQMEKLGYRHPDGKIKMYDELTVGELQQMGKKFDTMYATPVVGSVMRFMVPGADINRASPSVMRNWIMEMYGREVMPVVGGTAGRPFAPFYDRPGVRPNSSLRGHKYRQQFNDYTFIESQARSSVGEILKRHHETVKGGDPATALIPEWLNKYLDPEQPVPTSYKELAGRMKGEDGKLMQERLSLETTENLFHETTADAYKSALKVMNSDKAKLRLKMGDEHAVRVPGMTYDIPFRSKGLFGEVIPLRRAAEIFMKQQENVFDAMARYQGLENVVEGYLPLVIDAKGGVPSFVSSKKLWHLEKRANEGGVMSLPFDEIKAEPFELMNNYVNKVVSTDRLSGYMDNLKSLGATENQPGIIPKNVFKDIKETIQIATGDIPDTYKKVIERFYERIEASHKSVSGRMVKGLYAAFPSIDMMFAMQKGIKKINNVVFGNPDKAGKWMKRKGRRTVAHELVERIEKAGDNPDPRAVAELIQRTKGYTAAVYLWSRPSTLLQQIFQNVTTATHYGAFATSRAIWDYMTKEGQGRINDINKTGNKSLFEIEPGNISRDGVQVFQGGAAGRGEIGSLSTSKSIINKYGHAFYWHWLESLDTFPRSVAMLVGQNHFRYGRRLMRKKGEASKLLTNQERLLKGELSYKDFKSQLGYEKLLYDTEAGAIDRNLLMAEYIHNAIKKSADKETIRINKRNYSHPEAIAEWNKMMHEAEAMYSVGSSAIANYWYDSLNGMRLYGMGEVVGQMKKFYTGQVQYFAKLTREAAKEIVGQSDRVLVSQNKILRYAERIARQDFQATARLGRVTTLHYLVGKGLVNEFFKMVMGDDDVPMDIGNALPLINAFNSYSKGSDAVLTTAMNFIGPGAVAASYVFTSLAGAAMFSAEKLGEVTGVQLVGGNRGTELLKFGLKGLSKVSPVTFNKHLRFVAEVLSEQNIVNFHPVSYLVSISPEKFQEAFKNVGLPVMKKKGVSTATEAVLRWLSLYDYEANMARDDVTKILKAYEREDRVINRYRPQRRTVYRPQRRRRR
jgi:hypothetical protein